MTLDAPDPVAETPDVGGERSPLLVDLEARGLISDSTDLAVLGRRLNAGPITLYCGFDPTGPSLHAGHLQQLMLLGRIARAGHRPLVLVGGATGRIGDPSGRDSERPLLDDATLAANIASIREQVGRFIRFDGDPPGDDAVDDDGPVVGGGRLVDNHDWTGPLSLLDFLRDVGKHVTIGTMLARDSVRSRIDRSDGMSFTEFSYQLLQAYDFVHLHRAYDCELQVAGSDQWGNITAG
ncbi:MAG: tyrosine--tRNA ligase, partial [Microthrixaceae bacterium]|nr:tyrosine--tRNA ligase [Microthrixaceae bacterium]